MRYRSCKMVGLSKLRLVRFLLRISTFSENEYNIICKNNIFGSIIRKCPVTLSKDLSGWWWQVTFVTVVVALRI